MPAQLTTKAQVNGYRFLLRRLEHALIRRDVRMLHDPMRSQLRSLMVGLVLAILVLAGFGVYGLIKPQGSVGKSQIIISKKAGAMYVVLDGRLHPVLNLASARLITGSNESPKSVGEKKLTGYARGPLLGIPGAPAALPGPADTKRSNWVVCDTTSAGQVTTTVQGVAPVLGEQIRSADGADGPGDEAVLVSSAGQVHLIGAGRRSRVDTESVPVRRALDLDHAEVRAVSPGVLNAFPETDPIAVPDISNRGAPSALGRDTPVGSVFKVTALSGEATFYVALAQGVQRIGEVAAEIIRQADRSGADTVPTLNPGALTGVETVSILPTDDFPAAPPRFADATADPVVCAAWSRSVDDHEASLRTLLGSVLPLRPRDKPVPLSGADGPGPGLDAAFVTPGRGHYIQATGSEPDSTRAESLFYVNDSGVRFGVPDAATADVIGLGRDPLPAPWSVISLLAVGPTLNQYDALVSHDGIAPDLAGAQFEPPGN